jgi:hypothetical protein
VNARMNAEIERFTATSDQDVIHAAIERDGVAIIEGLLDLDVVARVNEEVEAAVEAADPDEPLFKQGHCWITAAQDLPGRRETPDG